jgi:hypothetical protein
MDRFSFFLNDVCSYSYCNSDGPLDRLRRQLLYSILIKTSLLYGSTFYASVQQKRVMWIYFESSLSRPCYHTEVRFVPPYNRRE